MGIDEEGYVSLFEQSRNEFRQDLALPDETEDDTELAARIRKGVEDGKSIFVTVLSAMGIEKITECSEKNN